MPVDGVIVCIGCRERLDPESLDTCLCAQLEEAETAENIVSADDWRCYMCGGSGHELNIHAVFPGGPMCVRCADTPRRCYKCDELKRLDYFARPTEMCFECVMEA